MSELRNMSETDRNTRLMKMGAAVQLSGTDVMNLILTYGPYVAELLINLIGHRRTLGATVAASDIGDHILQQLLVDFLTSHEKDIEQWIDAGESAIFDILINLVGSKSQLLALALSRYKDLVIKDLDPVVANAIDEMIALLKGPSA